MVRILVTTYILRKSKKNWPPRSLTSILASKYPKNSIFNVQSLRDFDIKYFDILATDSEPIHQADLFMNVDQTEDNTIKE